MEFTYYTDLWSMVQALFFGVILGLFYDVFRLLRRFFSFSRFFVAVQDILFWIISAVFIFFVCVKLNNGYIRIYFVLFALTGWGIYYFTVGRLVFAVVDFLIKPISLVCEKTRRAVIARLTKKCTRQSNDS